METTQPTAQKQPFTVGPERRTIIDNMRTLAASIKSPYGQDVMKALRSLGVDVGTHSAEEIETIADMIEQGAL